MKVVHVISRLNKGGTATYLSTLLPQLNKYNVETCLLVGCVSGPETEDDTIRAFNFVRIPSLGRDINLLKDLRAWWQLRKMIIMEKPDIIHSHAFKAGLLTRTMLPRLKHVHTFHGHHFNNDEFNTLKKRIIKYLERQLAKRSSKIISVGAVVSQDLIKFGIGKRKDHSVIYPGLELIEMTGKEESERILKLQKTNKCRVLWMGRFVDLKQPILVTQLAKKLPQIDFIMAGEGPLKLELEKLAPENLRILPWSDKEQLFSVADIILQTSSTEGLPMTLIEAQSVGLPAVATNVGSTKEIVEDGITGFLSDTNIEALSEAILKCISLLLKEEKKEAIRKIISAKFSSIKCTESHIEIYNGLC